MKKITFTLLAVTTTIDYMQIRGYTDDPFIQGSVDRNIDGDIISFQEGDKKEFTVGVIDASKTLYDYLKDKELNQTILEINIIDAITDTVEVTFNCIIQVGKYSYNNANDLYNFSLKALET